MKTFLLELRLLLKASIIPLVLNMDGMTLAAHTVQKQTPQVRIDHVMRPAPHAS